MTDIDGTCIERAVELITDDTKAFRLQRPTAIMLPPVIDDAERPLLLTPPSVRRKSRVAPAAGSGGDDSDHYESCGDADTVEDDDDAAYRVVRKTAFQLPDTFVRFTSSSGRGDQSLSTKKPMKRYILQLVKRPTARAITVPH
ncbi:MAG: hypothetical protein EKK49_07555, partial [Rhodocyclaceae bacterium]